jgi:hypothetical protein
MKIKIRILGFFIALFILSTTFCFTQDLNIADILKNKTIYLGGGIDTQNSPNGMASGGIAFPLISKTNTIMIINGDISAQEGAKFNDIIQGKGLKSSFTVSVAQKIESYKRFTLFGVVSSGPAVGPGSLNLNDILNENIESDIFNIPYTWKTAFAYGGFIDAQIKGGFGIDVFGQNVKDTTRGGFRPVVRVVFRYKIS